MRAYLKQCVEGFLVRGGAVWVARRRLSRRPAILAYHNVVPDDAPPQGEQSLHLPLSCFCRQLDLLRETHDVVALNSLHAESATVRKRPTAAITFDDAYLGAVTLAVEELVRRRLPATIFVAPGLLSDRSFWWDELATPEAGAVPQSLRRMVLDELGGRQALIREWAREAGFPARPLPDAWRPASEPELRTAARQPGINLAAHSWSHANLARLQPGEISDELERSLGWLRERFSATIDWLAYPYGQWSPAVETAARAAGFAGAVLNEGGLIPRRAVDPFRLSRVNVPSGLSDDGFVLRCVGLSR